LDESENKINLIPNMGEVIVMLSRNISIRNSPIQLRHKRRHWCYWSHRL